MNTAFSMSSYEIQSFFTLLPKLNSLSYNVLKSGLDHQSIQDQTLKVRLDKLRGLSDLQPPGDYGDEFVYINIGRFNVEQKNGGFLLYIQLTTISEPMKKGKNKGKRQTRLHFLEIDTSVLAFVNLLLEEKEREELKWRNSI